MSRGKSKGIVLASVLALAPLTAQAQLPVAFTNAVSKGPVVQSLSATSAVILVHTTSDEIVVEWGGVAETYDVRRTLNNDSGAGAGYRVLSKPIDGVLGGDKDAWIYEVDVRGLSPDTTYHYQVRVKTLLGEPATGDLVFTTAPLDGARFVFAVAGDNKAEPQDLLGFNFHNNRLTNLMVEDAELRLLLDTGDIVDDSTVDLNWTTFYRIRGDLMTRVAWFPALGNHDFDTPDLGTNFQAFISVPRTPVPPGSGLPANDAGAAEDTELFYSYDFGGVHFITYHGTGDLSPGSPQYEFLAADLAAHRCRGPIVVYGHQPWYSSAVEGGTNLDRQRDVHPLLAAAGVDLVLTGHRHFYERMDPAYPEMLGVTYIVSGGAGATPDDFAPTAQPYSVVRENRYHYVRFVAEGTTLSGEAIDENGVVFDAFTLPNTTANDPVDCSPSDGGPPGGDTDAPSGDAAIDLGDTPSGDHEPPTTGGTGGGVPIAGDGGAGHGGAGDGEPGSPPKGGCSCNAATAEGLLAGLAVVLACLRRRRC